MKMTMRLMCVLVGVASPMAAVQPLSLRVTPSVAMAPATVRVLATIEPDAQNRMVEIVTESDDFYRSSHIHLEGDRARRTNQLELHSLPPGSYEVTVTLKGPGDTTRATAHERVNVMGQGSPASEPASAVGPR